MIARPTVSLSPGGVLHKKRTGWSAAVPSRSRLRAFKRAAGEDTRAPGFFGQSSPAEREKKRGCFSPPGWVSSRCDETSPRSAGESPCAADARRYSSQRDEFHLQEGFTAETQRRREEPFLLCASAPLRFNFLSFPERWVLSRCDETSPRSAGESPCAAGLWFRDSAS